MRVDHSRDSREGAVPLVVELGRGDACDAALVGGKAAGLERLAAASLPCPPAYCVTTAALHLYLDATGLRQRMTALLEAAPQRDVLRNVRNLAYAEELPPELNDAVVEATDRLRLRQPTLELLAVRSSAADEDGDRHSFAGLHESELGIRVEGVPAALRKCWASLWSEASITYRSKHGLPLANTTMGVVVQGLVPAEVSAVVFTANPLTGSTDEVLIHATRGLGMTLMDNKISPDVAVLRKDDLAVKRLDVGDKHLRVDVRPAGGVVRSHNNQRAPALSTAEYRQLAELALEVEGRLGVPVDVEAALSGKWYLIQARPITAYRLVEG